MGLLAHLRTIVRKLTDHLPLHFLICSLWHGSRESRKAQLKHPNQTREGESRICILSVGAGCQRDACACSKSDHRHRLSRMMRSSARSAPRSTLIPATDVSSTIRRFSSTDYRLRLIRKGSSSPCTHARGKLRTLTGSFSACSFLRGRRSGAQVLFGQQIFRMDQVGNSDQLLPVAPVNLCD